MIMTDLETLNNTKDSVIVEIGAVKFDLEHGIKGEFYIRLDWTKQTDRTIGHDTLAWWTKQDKFIDVVVNHGKDTLPYTLNAFRNFIKGEKDFFSKGAFDYDILNHAYGSDVIKYYQHWEYRTMLKMAKLAGFEEPKKNNHNALDDAINQTEVAIFLMNKQKEIKY